MNWNAIVEKITPYIVKIETPNGHGTGFLCLYNQDKTLFGIATAHHVVSHALEWKQPIRLRHYPSSSEVFLTETERGILFDSDSDSAVILAGPGDLKIPEDSIPLLPNAVPLAIGTEVGWLGYPAMASSTLCFFSGNISARQEWRHAYLIDGVAINGVSGGPVLYSSSSEADKLQIVGTISAYVSNRATGDSLPGLSVARDVSHFHDTISTVKTLDEANQQKQKPPDGSQSPAPEQDQNSPEKRG
jgi:hypothetical protein